MAFLRPAPAVADLLCAPAPTWRVANPAPVGDGRRPRDHRPAAAENVPLDGTVRL